MDAGIIGRPGDKGKLVSIGCVSLGLGNGVERDGLGEDADRTPSPEARLYSKS